MTLTHEALHEALQNTGASVTEHAPLRRLAYWRAGGSAEFLVRVADVAQLRAVMGLDAPVTVLGNGSNALIHDDGIPGIVLQLTGELAGLTVSGTSARAGAGLKLVVLISRLDKAGLAGVEPFVGVPGTVGGAIVTNAGTRMGEASDIVTSVTVVLPGGEVQRLSPESLSFAYRHAELPEGAVIAEVSLALSDDEVALRKEARQAFLARRKASQPLNLPSCGSTFTNPPGDYAGRLIEAAGLKGLTRGGAQISEKHANFIVNLGDATAEDIRWLIATARCRVRDQFEVWMTPEVKLLGAWGPEALERV